MSSIRRVEIASPCAETAALTPAEGGFYCARCQHAVTDFRPMPDAAVLRHLDVATGRVCGRFTADQLHALNARLAALDAPARRWPTAAAALAAGLIAASDATAQTAPERPRTEQLPVDSLMSHGACATGAPTWRITGRVVDAATGEALAGASVVIDGTLWGMATDADGRFDLDLSFLPDTATAALRVSRIGYAPNTLAAPRGLNVEVNARLDVAPIGAGYKEVLVEYERPVIFVGLVSTIVVSDQREHERAEPISTDPPPMVRVRHYGGIRSRQ